MNVKNLALAWLFLAWKSRKPASLVRIPSAEPVERSHRGYTLEEYRRMGYVLRTGKKVGPYFERVSPSLAPKRAPQPAFMSKVGMGIVLAAMSFVLLLVGRRN